MKIFTDGSSHGNPGPGGFGVVVVADEGYLISEYAKQKENVTNNRMELEAILYSMLMYGVKEAPYPEVYTDSAYCFNTLTNWMFSWANNGWIKSDKKIPENLDIIKAYYEHYQKGYRINLQKIKGHAGHIWNERADKLATGKEKPIGGK